MSELIKKLFTITLILLIILSFHLGYFTTMILFLIIFIFIVLFYKRVKPINKEEFANLKNGAKIKIKELDYNENIASYFGFTSTGIAVISLALGMISVKDIINYYNPLLNLITLYAGAGFLMYGYFVYMNLPLKRKEIDNLIKDDRGN